MVTTKRGREFDQSFICVNATGATMPALLEDAIAKSHYYIGAPYANDPTCVVDEISASPAGDSLNADGTRTVIVTAVFRRPDNEVNDLSGEAGGTQEDTPYDYNGKLITVTYDGKTYPKLVPKFCPTFTANWTKTEYDGTNMYGQTLKWRAMDWVGKVSTDRKWMCTNLSFRNMEGSEIYWVVSYTFEYRADTWDALVWYTDKSGRMPTDGESSVKRVQIYDTHTFGGMV